MKYVKIIRLDSKPGAVIAQNFDVPLNMLIPVSVAGEFKDNVVKVESKYYFSVNETKHSVTPGQIIGLCINKIDPDLDGASRFSYLYDAAAKRRVFIGDLGAFSWGELVLKMTVAGLVYSTDGEIMEVPEALRTVIEQKRELETLSGRIDTLQSDLAAMGKKLLEKDEKIARQIGRAHV